MVRLLPVELDGKTVWIEDSPAACPDGHQRLVPTWGACPVCGVMLRLWPCREDGCTAPTQYDDEHVHSDRV